MAKFNLRQFAILNSKNTITFYVNHNTHTITYTHVLYNLIISL